MKITRELAINILKYLDQHKYFYFPFLVVNKEYTEEDDDFVEIEPSEWEMIQGDGKYQTFELWENLQSLDRQTLWLMSKGFIEKITNESLKEYISKLVKNYKKYYREELWNSKDSEEYGLNEFIAGKAEAYDDCMRIIKEYGVG